VTTRVLQGIGVSAGRAAGPAHIHAHRALADGGPRTWDEVAAARASAAADLRRLMAGAPPEAADILAAQAEMLEDPALAAAVRTEVERGAAAVPALLAVAETFAAPLAALPDPYLAARAADVREVARRWADALADPQVATPLPAGPFVLVASDLGPADTLALPRDRLLAIATERGGPGSHTAIVARALGIPAAVGVAGLMAAAREGQWLEVDGDRGQVQPVAASAGVSGGTAKAVTMASGPHCSRDGIRVQLLANIGRPEEAALAAAAGAEGVGLFRTELLFMESPTAPAEDVQLAAYRQALGGLGGRTLVVRTLDVGGDKPLPYLPLPPAANPQLSMRGLRLLDLRADVLRAQARALLRAAPDGGGALRVMFPMVMDAADFRRGRAFFAAAAADLAAEGTPHAMPKLGAMVEIPAAAATAGSLLREADFVSIGTNDLTQYTLAVDRDDSQVAARYDSLHPGVLRLIAMTGRAGLDQGKPVAVCGELGGDPLAAPLLLAWGVHEWSVAIPSLPRAARALAAWDLPSATAIAEAALAAGSAAEVRALLLAAARDRGLVGICAN
jgi:phosphoenolpyruvate-protein phosphotransferase